MDRGSNQQSSSKTYLSYNNTNFYANVLSDVFANADLLSDVDADTLADLHHHPLPRAACSTSFPFSRAG